MDLTARIRRRQRSGNDSRLVLDHDAISPVAHLGEPTGRGSVLERLLDYVDPVFDGELPPNAYVWGPPGTGKSAVVTALFARLGRLHSPSRSVIHTSTRGGTGATPDLVYVDARHASSDFGLYRTVLDAVLDESVPEHGVGTDALRARLTEYLAPYERRVLIAVDHVGERGARPLSEIVAAFADDESLSWLVVGRPSPSTLPDSVRPPEHIEVPAYRDLALVDVLTARASEGMARQAVEHEQLRRLASWADGNAHDALCALFVAADEAVAEGSTRLRERDLRTGMNAVPRPSVSLGRVFALPDNRQRVLRRLIDVDVEQRSSVDAAADAVVASPDIDLSAGTVKRLLYEIANDGIAERVASDRTSESVGRPPSRLEPRFPTAVFRRLYDLSNA
ncbi:Cdc6/Cdc18 family protein [Halococcus saccharolyticus]|uniref:Cell division control protein 6-like protein n=1 Tax=Halococcus saccharolyticus DSM 5350 TaxID=1227455 RepID=M0MH43_9EURY|nr:AAA family ATPase [Halococcus saccharolyticus]EMA43994.1 cell division control protein 6-like protein [Halococcus saccharolyticus DSM 5350]